MDEEIFLEESILFLISIYIYLKRRTTKRNRRWAVRPSNRDRALGGYYTKIFKTIKSIDPQMYFNHTRMQPELYELLLNLLKPSLLLKRRRISVDERLSATILYLAHGVPIQALALSYKLGRSTVRQIILETCDMIWQTLSSVYVSEPTESQYVDIAKDFNDIWNMPLCCGAIDGKHIAIKCPAKTGSMFFNYKKHFSIVLMAVCDAKYTFTAVSIGSYGSESDAGIFRVSTFGQDLLNNRLPLPPDAPLPNSQNENEKFSHFFVADAAYPLRRNIMRPYPGSNLTHSKKIFNYRLSRARRVIENSFGILTARWRILRTTMEWSPDNAGKVALACIALHNFIMLSDHKRWYCSDRYVDWESEDHVFHKGQWRADSGGNLQSVGSFMRRAQNDAFVVRDKIADYFLNEGALPFQDSMI